MENTAGKKITKLFEGEKKKSTLCEGKVGFYVLP